MAGCSVLPSMDRVSNLLPDTIGSFGIYRIELVQGNVVTSEQMALIRPGTSRAEVRDILGSPMLADVFHAERWDYPFSIRRGQEQLQQRVVTVIFEGDRVRRIEGGENLPSEREFVASISRYKPPQQPPAPLELSEEQRKALPAPVRAEVQSRPAPQGAARSYPPLESR